jgi:nitroreductase
MSDFSHKFANTSVPVIPVVAERFSPYLFDGREVESSKLAACLEAFRWAPSSFNDQPWRLILSTRANADAFQVALSCLMEANQGWAKNSGALLFTVYATKFAMNGKPNRVAFHDVGLAAANLTLQAQSLGLHVHQMAGVDPQKIRHTYKVPEDFEIGTAIAVGYAAPANRDSSELAARDQAPRSRKPLNEIVFANQFGQPAPGV